jgi:hypothetical protein
MPDPIERFSGKRSWPISTVVGAVRNMAMPSRPALSHIAAPWRMTTGTMRAAVAMAEATRTGRRPSMSARWPPPRFPITPTTSMVVITEAPSTRVPPRRCQRMGMKVTSA